MIFLFEISFINAALLQRALLKELGITYDKTGQSVFGRKGHCT
jgi:hypothetical protein